MTDYGAEPAACEACRLERLRREFQDFLADRPAGPVSLPNQPCRRCGGVEFFRYAEKDGERVFCVGCLAVHFLSTKEARGRFKEFLRGTYPPERR